METPIVDIRDVSFAYNGGEPVLDQVDLVIQPGDFTVVIGPNGGGKTTLLKLMLGLLRPDRGTIRVLGRPPLQAAPDVGYVPQDVHVNQRFPITALEVVRMGMLAPGKRWRRTSAADRKAALAALDRVGMADLVDRRIGALSGGQRQRVFIARALTHRPRVLFLDEPTASIDSQGQTDFLHVLRELNREVTILLVSHDIMVISSHAKSVACVNRRLHYHGQSEITADMLESMYPGSDRATCPVELVAHGLPHRVLKEH